MSFCSGLWIPLFLLPHGLQTLAKALPPYHLAQLALNTVGMVRNPTPAWGHVEALIAFTLLFLGLAAWGFWRDEGKTYG
jgi:ABC-2 type transport system permease protein